MVKKHNKKDLIFSVGRDQFEVRTFRVSGNGGQKVNKTESGVEIRHPASGAKGRCTDTRSQAQNKKTAFERLVYSKVFQSWIAAKTQGMKTEREIEQEVEKEMTNPSHFKLEVKDGKGWKEAKEEDLN